MQYEVDYKYKIPEWATVTISADDPEQAEALAEKTVQEMYDDITDLEIEAVREITEKDLIS